MKFFNPDYTNRHFFAERSRIFNKTNALINPTMDFCIRFFERLPDEEELDEDGLFGSGDSFDYCSWGYALSGRWIEAEEQGSYIWQWYNLYSQIIGQELGTYIQTKNKEELLDLIEEKVQDIS